MDADVRDPAARPDELGAELERRGDADCLDGDVGAEPAVSFMTSATRAPLPLLIVTSAPNSRA